MTRTRILVCLMVLFVGSAADVGAQASRVYTPPAIAPCKTVTVNPQGVGGAPVTVDATVGGVSVLGASTTRCAAVIRNAHATAEMRCAPTTLTVLSTAGFLIAAGDALNLTLEAQQAWNCIRASNTNVPAEVVESRP